MKLIIIFLMTVLLVGCSEIIEEEVVIPVEKDLSSTNYCIIGSGILCKGAVINETKVTLLLDNDMGKDLKITKITLGNNSCEAEIDVLLEEVETMKFFINNCSNMVGKPVNITIDWYDAITGPKFPRQNKGSFFLTVR